jgi:hypothetical protein
VNALAAELDRWGEAGRRAALWWRDDDVSAPRPELDRILTISQSLAIPVSLSVIPAATQPGLLEATGDPALLSIFQHGWAHVNHEPAGGQSELGDGRPANVVLAELTRGRARLMELFGAARVPPVLVPPWHSLSQRVAARLPETGIRCVSMLAAGQHLPEIAPGVALICANVDLVRWRNAPGFVGAPEAVRRLLGALRARRLGLIDGATPVGLLTHHWALDADAGRFLEALGRLVNDHPAARWIRPSWPDAPAA